MEEALGSPLKPHRGYGIGHPWYYVLGGTIPTPKQILAHVKNKTYKGYAAKDIAAVNLRSEPQRSEALREFKRKFEADLKSDLSGYRKVVRNLRCHRETQSFDDKTTHCAEVHTSMSLKTCHLINDFAHMIYLDSLLSKQPDLFEF